MENKAYLYLVYCFPPIMESGQVIDQAQHFLYS
jgi:hypothetical protein